MRGLSCGGEPSGCCELVREPVRVCVERRGDTRNGLLLEPLPPRLEALLANSTADVTIAADAVDVGV